MPFRQVATLPGIRRGTRIEAVEAAAEAEEVSKEAEGASKEVEERASALKTRANVIGSAIWVEANTSRELESPFSCVTN